jgi:hypothetical protein
LLADGKSENARFCGIENRRIRAVLESNCAILVCAECSIGVGNDLEPWQGGRDWRRHCFTEAIWR